MSYSLEQLEPEVAKEVLVVTCLNVMLAGLADDEVGFVAAHGDHDSFLALRNPDIGDTVWKFTGGDKQGRSNMATRIRDMLNR